MRSTSSSDAFRGPRPTGRSRLSQPVGDGGIDYLYAEGQILVRDEYLERVLGILEQPTGPTWCGPARPDPARHRGRGPAHLGGTASPLCLDALAEVDRQLGPGNRDAGSCPDCRGRRRMACPATEPQEVYDEIEPYPSVCPQRRRRGADLHGRHRPAGRRGTHPWLAPGSAMRPGARMTDPGGGPEPIPPYTGHGTFVAGVIAMHGARSGYHRDQCFRHRGQPAGIGLVPRLDAALGLGVDIFHLTIAARPRHDHPLIAFEAVAQAASASTRA